MHTMTAYFNEGLTLALELANELSPHRQGRTATSADAAARDPQLAQLRTVLRAALDAPGEAEASTQINSLLAAAAAAPALAEAADGSWHLHLHTPHADTISRRTVKAASGLAVLMDDDGWSRVKQCAAERCDDFYLDVSRNQSRRFCSRSCANRVNARAHRARAS